MIISNKSHINQSLKRSAENHIDISANTICNTTSGDDLSDLLKKQTELLNFAIPVLREYIPSGKDIIPIVTDSYGIVIHCHITNENKRISKDIGLTTGCNLSEISTGTNAFGLALIDKNIQVVKQTEHYLDCLKEKTTIACPIFDYNNRLIGTVGYFSTLKDEERHSSNLVKLVSNAIADKFWNNMFQKKLNNERLYAFNIMNNLSYGLFAIDLKNNIHWINDTACRTLNIRRTTLVNKKITDYLPNWIIIKGLLNQGKRLTDEEYTFTLNGTEERFLINAYSIKDLNEQTIGHVITIRHFSRVVNMLKKYTLNNPVFTFNDIIGQSSAIKQAIEIAKTAAQSPSTILITGESGTGKEVFAQAIHNHSSRNNENFVAINCGAISQSLIESELFGYEEGAFTGALKKGRPGKFELANKGTLFLDEIGEMPLEMQVKLLRAIQEKVVTRVGGTKLIPFDVRIIAATNKDLEKELQDGNFRNDLFYRLSVIPINLPSLNERKKDLPILIQHFLKQKSQLLTKPLPEIPSETMNQLLNHDWPGNVRELENTIEKLVLFGADSNYDLFSDQSTTSENKSFEKKEDFEIKSLKLIEKESIEKTLNFYDWNISKVASVLDIGRNTLYDKIKKHNISK